MNPSPYSSLSPLEFTRFKEELAELDRRILSEAEGYGEIKKLNKSEQNSVLELRYKVVSLRNGQDKPWKYSFALSYLDQEKVFSLGAIVSELRTEQESIRYRPAVLKKDALAILQQEIEPLVRRVFQFFIETHENDLENTQEILVG